MNWLQRRLLIRLVIPATLLMLIGSTLQDGATDYPAYGKRVSNRAPECANEWFGDTSPRRTAQLEAYVTSRTQSSPVLLFCLGMHKLSLPAVADDAGIKDIQKAARWGYAPAAEWLGMAYLEGLFTSRDLDNARYWLVHASDYNSKLARQMLYAFGVDGWRRDLVFGIGMLLNIAGAVLLCKRANGLDLRFLGPALLWWALYSLFLIKDDKFFGARREP